MSPARDKDLQPELLVVVDTEEEFDWGKPFDRANIATRNIPAQLHAHAIYDRLGIVPTYVIGYPVATDPVAVAVLRRLRDKGRAEIGAHLHPWVTPPHHEVVSTPNSYECNLPPQLERAKIEVLTDAIEAAFDFRPTIFKAGRHGFGANTARVLADLGYKVDCSVLPHSDLRRDGGPNFRGAPDQPYWLAEAPTVLEIPVTAGFIGNASMIGPLLPRVFDSRTASRARLPGLLGKTNMVARSRLTPEGTPAAEQKRLVEAMLKRGKRVFSMVYHSPSLQPGHTPYVQSEGDLHRFLGCIDEVATWFRDEMGGRFTTLSAVHARMAGDVEPGPAVQRLPGGKAGAAAPLRLITTRGVDPSTQCAAGEGEVGVAGRAAAGGVAAGRAAAGRGAARG